MAEMYVPEMVLQGLPRGPKQNGIDLSWLLYRGAASLHERRIKIAVESNALGAPQLDRLPILEPIYRHWQNCISSSSWAPQTIRTMWNRLRAFVAFVEETQLPLSISSILNNYLRYCAHTKFRSDLSSSSKYAYSLELAIIIAPVLDMDPGKLHWKSRIRSPQKLAYSSSKENLDRTAVFVQTLLETIEQLSTDAIHGPLPLTLRYAAGGEHSLHCGRHLVPIDSLKFGRGVTKKIRAVKIRDRRRNDTTHRSRARLINLRLDAELLIFINQTGCNLTQALQLTGSQFRYQSDGDYLRLFLWKNRAKHAVELRIHKSYRKHFESYLKWRSAIFPDDPDGLTFPFVWNDGEKALQRTNWAFPEARKLMKAIGQPFVHAQQLRKTIGNFFRRNLSAGAAAELLSHSGRTFRSYYEEPNHQSATSTLVTFWNDMEVLVPAPGPGACQDPNPRLAPTSPIGAPHPDCESAGGCLFCDKNRDLRTFDHVWNLVSLHQLKLVEFNADRTPTSLKKGHPVALTAERIASKLEAMKAAGDDCADWVTEATQRVKEGRFHPFYTAVFHLLEAADAR